MLKYILFALFFVIVVLNFSVRNIWKLIFKKEINSKEETLIRFACFFAALLLAAIIIFVA